MGKSVARKGAGKSSGKSSKSSSKSSKSSSKGGLLHHLRNYGIAIAPAQSMGAAVGAGSGYAAGDPMAGAAAGYSTGTLASMYTGDKAYTAMNRDLYIPGRTIAGLTGAVSGIGASLRLRGSKGFDKLPDMDQQATWAPAITGGTGLAYGILRDMRDYGDNFGSSGAQRRRRQPRSAVRRRSKRPVTRKGVKRVSRAAGRRKRARR